MTDLNFWYLTLPTGQKQGSPDRIFPPALLNFKNDYFEKTSDGITFRAPTKGVKTEHTKFCRTELRELNGPDGTLASWSLGRGNHSLHLTQSVEQLPPNDPGIIVAQIHGPGPEYIMLVKLSGSTLYVSLKGKQCGVLDRKFTLKTKYDLDINVAEDGTISVTYNQATTVTCPKLRCNECYFKTGSYVQSQEDAPGAQAVVKLYSTKMHHSK